MSTLENTAVDTDKSGPIHRVLAPIRGQLTVAAILAAIGSMLTLIPLAGIAQITGILLSDAAQAKNDIWLVLILSMASMLIGMTLISASEVVSHWADQHIIHELRLKIAQRLSQVPLGWFTSRASGEIKQAMQDDIAILHSLTAHFYTTVARAVGAILISLIYLFALDWRLALVVLLPFPGFFLFLRLAMKAGAANMPDFIAGMGRINSAVYEFVSGISVLKAFGASGKAHHSYHQAVDDFTAAFDRFTRPLVVAMAHAHAMVTPVTVLGLVLASGTLFVGLEWMKPTEILPFALVAPGICAPLLLLHTLLHDLGSATGAAERVLRLLDTPVLTSVSPENQRRAANFEICFENVSYAYNDGHSVLSDISFTLKPGTMTAIVGASGAGKSTLARLLLRFFDPLTGCIKLGGVDLRQIETSQLYRYIGFVLQEVCLIHASVRDNIALGRLSASQQEIEDAARAANIHERILALPRGYDSVIGEDAALSGGERQRLSIARAVLLNPPVLVLDEATAATDSNNEIAIQNALAHFARGRSLVVIAHQLDTVMHADCILVVEGGRIVEQGTHSQLLKMNASYARLWTLGRYHSAPVSEPQSC